MNHSLGPLNDLVGRWQSSGQGFNAIALPYADAPAGYRLLVNQYDEVFDVTLIDPAVPNRGISTLSGRVESADQSVVTLAYEQSVEQIAAADFPASGLEGEVPLAIHFEPGLFLHMLDQRTDDIDIARLASVPHGDSALALGRSTRPSGVDVHSVDGLPIGGPRDLDDPFLTPYRHFRDAPFGKTADFPGFDPSRPEALLRQANRAGTVGNVTRLTLDTRTASAGIHNIPFIVAQANAVSMASTFWTYTFDNGERREWRLQYLQVVMLEFLPAAGGGLLQWPHVSINTLTRAGD